MASSTPTSPKNSRNGSICSPEFEFWGLSDTNNPSSFPTIDLPSADELFSDGILLPLKTLTLSSSSNPNSPHALLDPCNNSFSTSSASPGPASKRWKDIFVKAGEREKKKDQKTRLSVGNNAELNINIWPFSRSRSADNASRARLATWRSSSSSAPCSRSNSRNAESSGHDGSVVGPTTASSMIKRWAHTGKLGPTVGIRVGRPGPVWQLRRNKQPQQQPQQEQSTETKDNGVNGAINGIRGLNLKWQLRRNKQQQQQSTEIRENDQNGAVNGIKGLNLNVNTCIGYANKSGCEDNESGGGNNGGMFSIKAIFSKKVY